jgi:hypothetical protein
MQEGLFSLMQMAKTTAILTRLSQARLPFISILTDPTMGGVSASFAFIGDVVIAEPGALIGFAGPRVIEQTVRETLPEGFQRSEFLLEKGAIDMIVDRREMKERVAGLLACCRSGRHCSERLGVSDAGGAGPRQRRLLSTRWNAGWRTSKASTRAGRRESNWGWNESSASRGIGPASAMPTDHRRRHQRQGFDLRLPRSNLPFRRLPRGLLHLAASAEVQRAGAH